MDLVLYEVQHGDLILRSEITPHLAEKWAKERFGEKLEDIKIVEAIMRLPTVEEWGLREGE